MSGCRRKTDNIFDGDNMSSVGIMGAGSWGMALAKMLCDIRSAYGHIIRRSLPNTKKHTGILTLTVNFLTAYITRQSSISFAGIRIY